MTFRACFNVIAALAFLAVAIIWSDTLHAEDDQMIWQYREAASSAGVGRKSAGLIFGVPETDNVQVQAGCDSGISAGSKNISLVLGADIGTLTDGAKVKVRFEGGRFKQSIAGQVHGTEIEEGVTGVHLQIAPSDPLWRAMQQRDALAYQADSYAQAMLRLKGGTSTIQRFVETCRRYADRSGKSKPTTTATSSPQGRVKVAGSTRQRNDGISEKEAFDSAKELGTIEGWEAFLKSFPTGFRADLARAYVRRLHSGGPGETSSPSTSTPTTQAVNSGTGPGPTLDTFESSPGLAPWRTLRYEMDEGNVRVRAAGVKANGVELLFHCDGQRLSGILREYNRGLYPNFDRRMQQGLAAKRGGRDGVGPVAVPFEFSNGRTYQVGAQVMELNGEVNLTRRSGGSFGASEGFISDLMSESSVMISAPPFIANLQLKKSRPELCGLIRSCGAKAAGCGVKKKTYTKKKTYKKKKKRKCRPSGANCSSHRQCCGRKCCLNDFEECEGIGGTCDG